MDRDALLEHIASVYEKLEEENQKSDLHSIPDWTAYQNFVQDRMQNSACITLSHMYMSPDASSAAVDAVKTDMCHVLQMGEQLKTVHGGSFLDSILEIDEIVGRLCMTILYT